MEPGGGGRRWNVRCEITGCATMPWPQDPGAKQQRSDNSGGALMPDLLDRITIDPGIWRGKPCIQGLRYPVETILELLSAGMTPDEFLADYEDLERDDILAARAFAARLSQVKRLQSLGA